MSSTLRITNTALCAGTAMCQRKRVRVVHPRTGMVA